MRMGFTCTTNKPYTAIRSLLIKSNGLVLEVDAIEEDYLNEPVDDPTKPRQLTVIWDDCFIRSVNGRRIFGGEGYLISDAESVEEFENLVKEASAEFVLSYETFPDDGSPYWVNIEDVSISS